MKEKISLRGLFKLFFNIGITGYGGPAVLGQMKNNLVEKKGRVSEKDFMESLSIANILPGATGVTLAGYLGFRFYGIKGSILISFAYLFPPFVLIVTLSYFYFRFGDLGFVKSIMKGLGALVVALIFNAIFQIGKGVFPKFNPLKDYKGIAIVILAFLIAFFFKQVNIIFIIFGAGGLGILLYYFTGEFEKEGTKIKNIEKKEINKELKKNIEKKWKNKKGIFWIGGLLLIVGLIFLLPQTRLLFYRFFIIGLFAFGGGFTTIPMIQHQIVNTLQWLPLDQFRDGIALGQITPGSFLISSAFIGYKVYGIIGAIVATIGIYLPPIILITALSKVHTKVKELTLFRVITQGLLTGFLGILLSTLISFAEVSLLDYKTRLIAIFVFIRVKFLKKDAIWTIIGTIIISIFIF